MSKKKKLKRLKFRKRECNHALNIAVAAATLGMTMGINLHDVMANPKQGDFSGKGGVSLGEQQKPGAVFPKVERSGAEFPKVERPEVQFPKVEQPGAVFPKVERSGAEFPKVERQKEDALK